MPGSLDDFLIRPGKHKEPTLPWIRSFSTKTWQLGGTLGSMTILIQNRVLFFVKCKSNHTKITGKNYSK